MLIKITKKLLLLKYFTIFVSKYFSNNNKNEIMKTINLIKSIILVTFIILINACTDINDDINYDYDNDNINTSINTDSTRILILSVEHYTQKNDAVADNMSNIQIVYLHSFPNKDIWSSYIKIYVDSLYTIPYKGTNEYQKVIESDLFYISNINSINYEIIKINTDGILVSADFCYYDLFLYDGVSLEYACSDSTGTLYQGDAATLADCTILYNYGTTNPAPVVYCDGTIWRSWNGTSFTGSGVCPNNE